MKKQLSLNLSIGKACFSRCRGCYNHWGKGELIADKSVLNFLSFIRKNTNIRKVTLCGGDPLSRPNILEIIQKIKDLGFAIQLDTVGTPLLGKTSKTIFYGAHDVSPIDPFQLVKLVDLIGIPIDGITSVQANLFRSGRPNIIEETLEILDVLSQADANVCVNTVVHKGNVDDIFNIFDLVKGKPAIKKWQFFQFQGTGPLGFKNKKHYEISLKEFDSFTRKTKRLSKNLIFASAIEFKSVNSRKNNYLLIDTSGIAWMPDINLGEQQNSIIGEVNKRIIIGDIKNKLDYEKILNAVLNRYYDGERN